MLAHPRMPERLKVELIGKRVYEATQGRVIVPVARESRAGL